MSLRPRQWGALALLLVVSACASHEPRAEKPLRVAACQIHVDGDREAALARIDAALIEAVAGGADIACFPETCLMGWVNPLAHELADPIPGPTTDRLAELARRHGVMLAVGLAEKDDDHLYDSVVLIDSDGALLAKHRKVNVLSELMEPSYTPGGLEQTSVVETRFGRIGMLICADTFVDEIVEGVAKQQPDLVLVPYGWAAPTESWPQHGQSLHGWISHTARRAGAPVVGVDSIGSIEHGPWTGFIFGGQSAYSDAEGVLSPALADRAREVAVLEVLLR